MTSATERLRALLDERGVEWWQSANTLGCVFTRWYSPLFGDEVCAMENGEEGLVLFDHFMTPEQAIAATLGSCNVGRYVGLRQGEYWERTENSNYYCGGCGWKVTDHDSYCPECGGALHEYALGPGTCEVEESWHGESEMVEYRCTACDEYMAVEVVKLDGAQRPNYCPSCGRRVIGGVDAD